jgi:hypothetical protein
MSPRYTPNELYYEADNINQPNIRIDDGVGMETCGITTQQYQCQQYITHHALPNQKRIYDERK